MAKARKKTTSGSSKPRSDRRSEAFKRTRQDHASEMGEDYVELIDDLLGTSGEARLVEIADRMGVSHVTASRIISRLQREGLVETKPYRAIFLTDQGKKLADETRKRHELVLNLLLAIGVPEQQALIDAEGLEHHISDVTFRAISKYLENRKR